MAHLYELNQSISDPSHVGVYHRVLAATGDEAKAEKAKSEAWTAEKMAGLRHAK